MSIQFSPKVENCLRLRSLAYANLILGTVSVTFQVIFKICKLFIQLKREICFYSSLC